MDPLPLVKLNISVHHEKEIVQVLFSKNEELTKLLRSIAPLRWSKTMNCWYLPKSTEIVKNLFAQLKGKILIEYSSLKQNWTPQIVPAPRSTSQKPDIAPEQLGPLSKETEQKIHEFRMWLCSKRYSENTIGTYCDALKLFLRYHVSKNISEICNEDVILFNNRYILSKGLSASFQNQVVNAIKLFFRTIDNKKLEPELVHRPQRQKLLPNVLSKEEVKQILGALTNLKHRTMLSLIYSCGLRCGELLRLKPEHIDRKRHLIIIKQSKGRKDRIAPLSGKIIGILSDYYIMAKPQVYLFEGQKKGEPYDMRSLQNVLKQSVEKAGIKKPVTLHWLRHSYATHLLEAGTDLRYIQEILGHSRSTTTEIYTHVSTKGIQNVISPFDSL